jgi:hypothetical protein
MRSAAGGACSGGDIRLRWQQTEAVALRMAANRAGTMPAVDAIVVRTVGRGLGGVGDKCVGVLHHMLALSERRHSAVGTGCLGRGRVSWHACGRRVPWPERTHAISMGSDVAVLTPHACVAEDSSGGWGGPV